MGREPRVAIDEQPTVLGDDEVRAVALSADGELVAGGGADGTVRVWRTTDGGCARVLGHHAAPVEAIRFAADGRLVSGDHDGLTLLWPAAGDQPVARFENQSVTALAFSPGDDRLAVSSYFGGCVHHAAGGPPISEYRAQGFPLGGLSFARDGSYLAAGDTRGRIFVWDPASGEHRRTWRVELRTRIRGWFADLRHAPFGGGGNGDYLPVEDSTHVAGGALFAAAILCNVRVWRASGWFYTRLPRTQRRLTRVAPGPDRRTVVASDEGGQLYLWELRSGRLLHTFFAHTGRIGALATSGDGRWIASAGAGPLHLWKVRHRS